MWQSCSVVPRLFFNVTQEKHATLKSWEWPVDKASSDVLCDYCDRTVHCESTVMSFLTTVTVWTSVPTAVVSIVTIVS